MRSHVLRIILLAALCSACITTRLVDTWRDPAYSGPPLHKVLACGLHPDEATRRLLTDAAVKELQARGVEAVACYRVLPEGRRPTPEELHEAVRNVGAEGAVVTRYVGTHEEIRYEPASYVGFGAPYWGPFYSSYGSMWDYVAAPGYLEADIAVRLVTNIYRVDDGGQLLWSGTSDTFNPTSAAQLAGAALPKVLDRVDQAGLLPKKP